MTDEAWGCDHKFDNRPRCELCGAANPVYRGPITLCEGTGAAPQFSKSSMMRVRKGTGLCARCSRIVAMDGPVVREHYVRTLVTP